jgi:hypothetical protein
MIREPLTIWVGAVRDETVCEKHYDHAIALEPGCSLRPRQSAGCVSQLGDIGILGIGMALPH